MKIVVSLLIMLLLQSTLPLRIGIEQAQSQLKPKNVILFIGDGMGISYLSTYRYMQNGEHQRPLKQTFFDQYLVGFQMTQSSDPKEEITDSAAAATAMATGKKTYNGAIAVDLHKKRIKTILEEAKQVGKSTGLVVTTHLTHATPAAFAAHEVHRSMENQIADDLIDDKINGKPKVDILLGGGRDFFVRNDRNVAAEFVQAGYQFVQNRQQLHHGGDHILGLFSPKAMPKAIDRPAQMPHLAEMTKAAIKRLSKNPDGFFLMVEGSQIDTAGHDHDIVAAMSEVNEFEQAVQAGVDFAKQDQETLVLATADHSTGGLTVGNGDGYRFTPQVIKQVKHTPDLIAKEVLKSKDIEETLKKHIQFPLRQEEIQRVKLAVQSKNLDQVDQALETIFTKRSRVGWTTNGHTGEDVPVYAFGPGKQHFTGLLDNTEIAKELFTFIK
ncbi:alkaline phosphatase [Seinonella peptonophila]|uniref:Alkaline phosphatase n=1 Tax=Seinonella peptonophila TaxID=112248 RepID=A0A1M4Y4B8_9BACL|nr:alkaline phosphatase [Seinonella peptonophila]SHF00510.1 alkaline phosphatase [Seinonella peptonophila]